MVYFHYYPFWGFHVPKKCRSVFEGKHLLRTNTISEMPSSVSEVLGDEWYGSAVLHEIRRLRKVLQPIAVNSAAPLEPVQSNNTLFPFV